MSETAKRHVFEHIAPAPYRYRGVTQNRWSPCAGVPSKPGGTCDHCSTGIEWEFWFEASNGKRFKVGSSCVSKSGDAGLKRVIADDVRKHQAELRAARDNRNRDEARALLALPAVKVIVTAKPHPTPYYASQGKTLLDYYEFLIGCGGADGRRWLVKQLAEMAANAQ